MLLLPASYLITCSSIFFFVVFILQESYVENILCLPLLHSFSLYVCFSIGCNIWNNPKSLTFKFYLYLVLIHLLINKNLSPRAKILSWTHLLGATLGHGKDFFGKLLLALLVLLIISLFFLIVSKDWYVFQTRYKDADCNLIQKMHWWLLYY